jgi:uncharacterized protein affecting Mg2+/Co2+ transport
MVANNRIYFLAWSVEIDNAARYVWQLVDPWWVITFMSDSDDLVTQPELTDYLCGTWEQGDNPLS